MQVTVNIPDELAAQVQARGQTPESFVNDLIRDAARVNVETSKALRRDLERFFREMAASSSKIPQLSDEAFSRESFYRDED